MDTELHEQDRKMRVAADMTNIQWADKLGKKGTFKARCSFLICTLKQRDENPDYMKLKKKCFKAWGSRHISKG